MRKYRVRFHRLAEDDLAALNAFILEDSGPDIADAYLDRIEAACMALADFPKRGAPRDDLRPGLRVVAFERRVTIAYLVVKGEVIVRRILYRGRDIDGILRGSTDA
jgi:toxin ParE1/3/4